MNEFEIISKLKSKLSHNNNDVIIGIGDDTALLSKKYGNLLITQDSISEGVHFDLNYSSGKNIANKLFNSNISDIASMGGKAKFALISAGLTKSFNKTHLDTFLTQISKKANIENISLIGGDTISSKDGSAYFTMTLFGDPIDPKKVLKRNTANIGDIICTTGYTGISALGLHLLCNHYDNRSHNVIQNHLNATHRADIIEKLLKFNITSMTDISDGLIFNAMLLPQKGNGIHITNIARSPQFKEFSNIEDDIINDFILTGGEDFELIFSISKENFKSLKKSIPEILEIGEIIKENKIQIKSIDYHGKNVGFEHKF